MNTHACLLALDKALQMEIDGMAFYRKASAESENVLTKEMFSYLADAEITHMDRIKQLSGSLKASGNWCKVDDGKTYTTIGEVFSRLAKDNRDNMTSAATDIQALDTGLDLEVKSIDFYNEQLAASTDANQKAFYKSLIDEENTHFRTLKDMKFYLEEPEAWFTEHEKHGMDGA